MIKELLKCQSAAEKISRTLVEMFNNGFNKTCKYYDNTPKEIDKELFMNFNCKHPKGDGHCSVALCPRGE